MFRALPRSCCVLATFTVRGNLAKDLDKIVPPSPLDKENIRRFRSSFIRSIGLGRRPTIVEGSAIDRAVLLMIQARSAMTDPNVSHCDRVRLDGAARRAARDVVELIASTRKQSSSLSDYLKAHADREAVT